MAVEAGWTSCHNTACEQDFSSQNKSFFMELSITDQLKAFFKRNGFYNDLQHRFNHGKQDSNIEDIYDGSRYQQHMKRGSFLASKKMCHCYGTRMVPLFLNHQAIVFGRCIL